MVKKKALGKGLGALIPDRSMEEGRGVIDIKIDEIRTSTNQPRKDFAKNKMQELVASISEKGVIQPIIVRRSGQGFDLIAGERRLRAAKMLGYGRVPCVVRDATDEDAFEISLIENLQRQDLNPIEEANGYKRLIEVFGLKQEEVGKKVGKDRATVANTLRLLKLPDDIKKALSSGVISAGHAKALLSCEEKACQKEIFYRILKRGLSVRETEKLSARKILGKRVKAGAAVDLHLEAIAEEMQRKLATKVTIRMRGKKKGSIEISFFSPGDLDRLIDVIL
ncbi:MAG: ParB/RepB/Spo0J family partition protein [Candidatus Tritonobacter lacicola]|nr:ParB/RepB/Spo0J family partition protein [Candidatus Tritonobacter lacicola]